MGDDLYATVGRGNRHLGALGKEADSLQEKMGRKQVATALLLRKQLVYLQKINI